MIFVFSLDDELSFSVLSSYYAKMAQYRKYISDIPVVLVALNGEQKKSNEIVKKIMKRYRSLLERELGSGGGGVVFGAFWVWPHPAIPWDWVG